MKNSNRILIVFSLILFLGILIILLVVPKIEVRLNGEQIITINVGDEYNDAGAEAYVRNVFFKKNLEVSKKGVVDTQKIGNYFVTYEAKHLWFSKRVVRTVVVKDTEAPQLTVFGDTKICKVKSLVDFQATAVDNIDGDISDKIEYKVDDNKISITVSDKSGNTSEVTKDLIVMDNEIPSIILNGGNTTYITLSDKYSEQGATATDSCDGDLTSSIKTSGTVDTSTLGEYYITYTVTDSSNNTVEAKRKVVVQEVNKEPVKETKAVNGATIYLTFDDGPGAYTEKILEILDKYGIKATFFVTNQMGDKYQYLIKKEYESGHTVGIHTYSHRWYIYDTFDDYLNDFEKIKEIVVNQTGVEPKYFRFPGGTSNHQAKISMTELSKLMTEKGYVYFDWNVSVEDAGSCTKKKTDAEKEKCVIYYFKQGLKNDSSNIILMHDIKKSTMNALPEIIEYAKEQGYRFSRIDENTPLKQFKPYN